MNFRHIEIFHAVYVHGSVSAAANALNVSQPSVSKVLRHAEQTMGLELFQRTRGRLVPTQDAHALFAEVAEVHEKLRALRQTSRNLRDGRGAVLRVSALPSLGLDLIPRAVASYLDQRSDVLFDLQTLHHDEILRKLYERETDVAISFHVPPGAPVGHRVVGEGELVVLYREEQMPDAPPRLSLDRLNGQRFISPVQAGPLGWLLSTEMARLNVTLEETVSARTYYVAAGLVKAGVGMAIVDNFTAEAARERGLSYRPLQPAIAYDINAVFLQSRPPSQAMGDFLDRLTAIIDTL